MSQQLLPSDRGDASLPAILGGEAVHAKEWPKWPRAGMAAQRSILDVLHSHRWTISALTPRADSYERRFGRAFGEYLGRRFAVPCASGTAALTIAMQALGIGPGDEVIVPGLTWIACPSAVLNLGAAPIPIDIEVNSFAPCPMKFESAISKKTKAVLAVHMYSHRIDMPGLKAVCDRHGLAMIEDASQAHGAQLGDKKVGSFGAISIFSFHQTKLLACGEGGIALTDDKNLYATLQQLRADGRTYSDAPISPGFFGLATRGAFTGRNLCLSEFHAALLLEGLERLDRENTHRRAMFDLLDQHLGELEDISVVRDQLHPRDGSTHYKIPVEFSDPEVWGLGPHFISEVLTTELHLPVRPLDRPLTRDDSYRPNSIPLVSRNTNLARRCCPSNFDLPIAFDKWSRSVALPHQCLLGGEPEVLAIAVALRKLRSHTNRLRQLQLSASRREG